MMSTVYYIVHKDTARRLKYYKTLAGARIAMRARNARLGFTERVARCIEADIEYELCNTLELDRVLATYCVVEDTVDAEEFFTEDKL